MATTTRAPMPIPPASRLNQRWELQQKGPPVRDEVGADVSDWRRICDVWVSVEHTGSVEVTDGSQTRVLNTFAVEMRFRGDVHAGQRLKRAGRVLDIQGVVDVGMLGVALNLTCVERPEIG